MILKQGIDVSEHNGVIDWEKVREAGVEFAMIRAGTGLRADYKADRNFKECSRLGIPCGAYWFSYAMTPAQAAQEAAVMLQHLKGYRIDYPVAYDFEYDSVSKAAAKGVHVGTQLASDMARAFLRAVREAGYVAVNYTNVDYLRRYFDGAVQREFPVWLAQWPGGTADLEAHAGDAVIWQYSATGKVPGISTAADMDVCYVDYCAEKRKEAETRMSDKEIYEAVTRYAAGLEAPAWAEAELAEAVRLGITDGKKPMGLVPRYQAAIMAVRAAREREAGEPG